MDISFVSHDSDASSETTISSLEKERTNSFEADHIDSDVDIAESLRLDKKHIQQVHHQRDSYSISTSCETHTSSVIESLIGTHSCKQHPITAQVTLVLQSGTSHRQDSLLSSTNFKKRAGNPSLRPTQSRTYKDLLKHLDSYSQDTASSAPQEKIKQLATIEEKASTFLSKKESELDEICNKDQLQKSSRKISFSRTFSSSENTLEHFTGLTKRVETTQQLLAEIAETRFQLYLENKGAVLKTFSEHELAQLLASDLLENGRFFDLLFTEEQLPLLKELKNLGSFLNELLENTPDRLTAILTRFTNHPEIQDHFFNLITIRSLEQARHAAKIATALALKNDLSPEETSHSIDSTFRKLLNNATTDPSYVAEALHELFMLHKISIGTIDTLRANSYFPLAMFFTDNNSDKPSGELLSPALRRSALWGLMQERMGNEQFKQMLATVGSMEQEPAVNFTYIITFDRIYQKAINSQKEFFTFIDLYDSLIHSELPEYNSDINLNDPEDPAKGHLNPSIPPFCNEALKIDYQLIQSLEKARTNQEVKALLAKKNWQAQELKPALQHPRPKDYMEQATSDFIARSLATFFDKGK